MLKSKPTRDDIETFIALGTCQTGRRPMKPKGLDHRLEQFVKEGERWMRLCAEVWFPHDDQLIEEGTGALTPDDLAERYESAIVIARWVAGCAKLAEAKLTKGKKLTAQKQEDVGLAQRPAGQEHDQRPEAKSPKDQNDEHLGPYFSPDSPDDEDLGPYFS